VTTTVVSGKVHLELVPGGVVHLGRPDGFVNCGADERVNPVTGKPYRYSARLTNRGVSCRSCAKTRNGGRA
jgi:hypothetical protein